MTYPFLQPASDAPPIPTTNPDEMTGKDSGVAQLYRHFLTNPKLTPAYALEWYGIGRLSARVFDLNAWYASQGLPQRIVCVKRSIVKRNGRKAYVTDYYKLEGV